MTENERNLRLAVEAQMKDLNRILDKAITEAKMAHEMSVEARKNVGNLLWQPKWQPYPAEKPIINGSYITTCRFRDGRLKVQTIEWNTDRFVICDEWGMPRHIVDDMIIAWMRLPEPYKEAEPCTCANCKHLETSELGEAVCGEAHKSMVSPYSSCGWFERRGK